MKRLLLSLTLLLLASGAFPCYNYYFDYDKEGRSHVIGRSLSSGGYFTTRFIPRQVFDDQKELQEKIKKEKSYKALSDFAVNLCKMGKAKEALVILKELYRRYPNEYRLASNLGTTYELNGMNDSALKYIKRGLELNPNDHEGSEWVHAQLLEAKIAMASDPHYLDNRTVLTLDKSMLMDSMVLKQIIIQLEERFPFINQHDPIMADLFETAGDISANTFSQVFARAYYQIAREYYGDDSKELKAKIDQANEFIRSNGKLPHRVRIDSTQVMPNLPEELRIAGKIEDFNYKRLVIEIQPGGESDWSKINTDPIELLRFCGIELPKEEAKAVEKERKEVAEAKAETETAKTSSSFGMDLLYIFLAVGLGIIAFHRLSQA